jgi:hypothetical protein
VSRSFLRLPTVSKERRVRTSHVDVVTMTIHSFLSLITMVDTRSVRVVWFLLLVAGRDMDRVINHRTSVALSFLPDDSLIRMANKRRDDFRAKHFHGELPLK